MYKDIEKMLDEGMTPENMYQEALRIVEARNAAAAKVNQEKIAKARGELLTAIGNYTEAVIGKPVDKKFMEDTAKRLISIEDNAEKKDKNKSKVRRELSDEEKIEKFLKLLGAW